MATQMELLQDWDFCMENPNVNFSGVQFENYYRKANTYRLFTRPGVSHATLSFGLAGATNLTKFTLKLNHCRTTAHGKVHITVNGTAVFNDVLAPRDDFGWQYFQVDPSLLKAEGNEIVILLTSDSPGVYWLSDAKIYIQRVVDKEEEIIYNAGKAVLSIFRKLILQRQNFIKKLREIADDMDKIHRAANSFQLAGEVSKLTGLGLMVFGGALDLFSAATATPLVASMEAGSYALEVGPTAVDAATCSVENIKSHSEVKEAEEMFANDKRLREAVQQKSEVFKQHADENATSLKAENPSLLQNTQNALIGAAFVKAIGMGTSTFSSKFSNSELSEGFEIFEHMSEEAFQGAFDGIGAFMTFDELLKTAAEKSHGSPLETGRKLRASANALERDLDRLLKFMETCLSNMLGQIKDAMQNVDLRVITRLFSQLELFDVIGKNGGKLDTSWLNHLNNYEKTLTQRDLETVSTIFTRIYVELKDNLRRTQSNHADLILVGHGSVGKPIPRPVQVGGLADVNSTTTNTMFPCDNLTSVLFYQPWGVSLDSSAYFAILNGSIEPAATYFQKMNQTEIIKNTMGHFNGISPSPNPEVIPLVWCNAIEDNDPALSEVLKPVHNAMSVEDRPPFLWWRHASVPTFCLTSLAAMAAMMLSDEQNKITVSVHHGMSLDWRTQSPEEPPPPELLEIKQYDNRLDQWSDPQAMYFE